MAHSISDVRSQSHSAQVGGSIPRYTEEEAAACRVGRSPKSMSMSRSRAARCTLVARGATQRSELLGPNRI